MKKFTTAAVAAMVAVTAVAATAAPAAAKGKHHGKHWGHGHHGKHWGHGWGHRGYGWGFRVGAQPIYCKGRYGRVYICDYNYY